MEDSNLYDPITRLKRKRCDPSDSAEGASPLSPSTQDITRSSDFWYRDGNIILQVKTTQFRVHCGVLSTHSTFFADMFKIPQAQNENLVEGCQVVCMHDAAEDWENILMVMYQPLKVHPLSENLSTRHLLSMLRLGNKYQFDMMYGGALTRLKSELPSTLEGYDSLNSETHIDGECPGDGCYVMACQTWNLFELINAAVELNIEVVLPIAYYIGSSKSIQEILNGSKAPNGKVVGLHRHVQEILLVGRDNIREAVMQTMCPWVYGRSKAPIPCTECKTSDICRSAFTEATKSDAYHAMVNVYFALYHLMRRTKLCAHCLKTVETLDLSRRAQMWDSFPSHFGLPEWEDLRAQ